jgi:xylose dehydrogenase (NAD/NADP)
VSQKPRTFEAKFGPAFFYRKRELFDCSHLKIYLLSLLNKIACCHTIHIFSSFLDCCNEKRNTTYFLLIEEVTVYTTMASSSTPVDDPPVVTFAVISTATIAKNKVIPSLISVPSTVIVGVSSRSKERAQAFVNENCPVNDDYPCRGMTHDEVLSSTTIEAVYVPLPSRVRNEYIKKALEHGKHVYSEKPSGGTVMELKSILDLAAEKNLQFMDGTMWYHSNRTKKMEEKLYGNILGKVLRVSASFTWGSNGLVDNDWVEGGDVRTDPSKERFGMLGDSGHYPISAVAWAFGWELPTKVRATHYKFNTLGAIIECEAYLWFKDGGRAIIETSCLRPHRSQFEVVCEKGVLKVDDLVGGQGRSGNFGAYEGPFVGSSSFIWGDHLGKDAIIEVEPCDHVQCLVSEFSESAQQIRQGGRANPDWSHRTLCTHTIMCSIFESAMRDGTDVEMHPSPLDNNTTKFVINGKVYDDLPTDDR